MDESATWHQSNFGLDTRLIKALSKLGYTFPTLVQAQCIPLALRGKDVMVRARTGSGKTVAFALPLLHKLITLKSSNGSSSSSSGSTALILAPTNELIKQIEKNMIDLTYYCKDLINITAISDESIAVLSSKLKRKPDIIISTPSKLVKLLKLSNNLIDLSYIQTLVIDEADLILSFGYAAEVQVLTAAMPKIFQGMLMSATLSPELDKFKRVLLHNPAVLKLDESGDIGNLLQFYLLCSENDKFLTLYVFLKLGLLQGRGLVFVNDVNKCYRLKLFLKQFAINAAVLNSEVPLNSRLHALEEYNKGVFDLLIATDSAVDSGLVDEKEDDENNIATTGCGGDGDDDDDDDDGKPDDEGEEEVEGAVPLGGDSSSDEDNIDDDKDDGESDSDSDDDDEAGGFDGDTFTAPTDMDNDDNNKGSKSKKNKKNKVMNDNEYGVSRGIDFHGVSYVINFDLAATAAGYTHRIGRCARGGASGTALSFVTTAQTGGNGTKSDKMNEVEQSKRDSAVLMEVRELQPRLGVVEGDNLLGNNMGNSSSSNDNNDNEIRKQPAPLDFDKSELESFRYRVEDVLRSVTGVAVAELRTAEIKHEILNAARLQEHFAENPNDLKILRHDKTQSHPVRTHEHLKHVPSYLIPMGMRSVVDVGGGKRKRGNKGGSRESRINAGKTKDPLLGGDSMSGTDGSRKLTDKELRTSTANRVAWKQRHKKGKFNAHNAPSKRGLSGSLIKPKKHLG